MNSIDLQKWDRFKKSIPKFHEQKTVYCSEVWASGDIFATNSVDELVNHLKAGYVAIHSGNTSGYAFYEPTLGKFACFYPSSIFTDFDAKELIHHLNVKIKDSPESVANFNSKFNTIDEFKERMNPHFYYIIKKDIGFWEFNPFTQSFPKYDLTLDNYEKAIGRSLTGLLIVMQAVATGECYKSVNMLLSTLGYDISNNVGGMPQSGSVILDKGFDITNLI